MPLPPAMVFPFGDVDDRFVVHVGAVSLRGWSLTNPATDAPANVELFDGVEQVDVSVALVDLLASETTREWFSGNGILLRTGALLAVGSGLVKGSLYLTPISNAADMSWAFGESGPYFVHGGV